MGALKGKGIGQRPGNPGLLDMGKMALSSGIGISKNKVTFTMFSCYGKKEGKRSTTNGCEWCNDDLSQTIFWDSSPFQKERNVGIKRVVKRIFPYRPICPLSFSFNPMTPTATGLESQRRDWRLALSSKKISASLKVSLFYIFLNIKLRTKSFFFYKILLVACSIMSTWPIPVGCTVVKLSNKTWRLHRIKKEARSLKSRLEAIRDR